MSKEFFLDTSYAIALSVEEEPDVYGPDGEQRIGAPAERNVSVADSGDSITFRSAGAGNI